MMIFHIFVCARFIQLFFSDVAEKPPTPERMKIVFFWVWLAGWQRTKLWKTKNFHHSQRREERRTRERRAIGEKQKPNKKNKIFHPTQRTQHLPLMDEKAFSWDWYRDVRRRRERGVAKKQIEFSSLLSLWWQFSRESREMILTLLTQDSTRWKIVSFAAVSGLTIRRHVIEQFESWDFSFFVASWFSFVLHVNWIGGIIIIVVKLSLIWMEFFPHLRMILYDKL